SRATTVPLCTLASATRYLRSPIHHSFTSGSASRTPPPGTTLIQPRTPYDPATRPISIRRSGCLLGKLLDEALGRRRELRAASGPVLHALHVDAQRLAPL